MGRWPTQASVIAIVVAATAYAGRAPSRQERAPPSGVLLPSKIDRVLGDLLVPHPSRITRLSSSHDPWGGNRDADCDVFPREDGWVEMFNAEGEGRITRLWMNADYEHDIQGGDWKEIWIEADGRTIYKGDPLDWFYGKAGPVPPMVMDQEHSSGGFVSWVPIPYRTGAKIRIHGEPHYFQVNHREGPGSANGPSVESVTQFMTDEWWKRAPVPDRPARVHRLVLAAGPTLVTDLALSFAPADLPRLRMRIGDQPPFPATYLFGFGAPRADVAWPEIKSALVYSDPATHTLATRIPLPLRAGEALTVEGEEIDLTWAVREIDEPIVRANGAHVVTQFRDRHAPGAMTTTPVLEARGSIELVSMVEELSDGLPGDRTFLEGDEMIRFDGMKYPMHLGTGTEDYFNGGWYFLGVHSNPLSGLSRLVVTHDQDGWGSALFEYSMHRHHVLDAPIARSGMQMGIEIGADGAYAPMKVRTFALAYAFAGPRELARQSFRLDDASGEGVIGVPDTWIESANDAEADSKAIRFAIRGGPRTTTLTIACPKHDPIAGALVVRTYDAASAPQRATISVRGRPRGAFFEPRKNPHRRFAQDERWIEVEPSDCKGGALTIEVNGTGAEFTESGYEVTLYGR